MGTFLWLAVEASAVAEPEARGLGFNFDILETNLINLIIIAVALVYFGRGF